MKIWFEKSYWYGDDTGVDHLKFGIGWFKHSAGHPYKGLTVNFIFFEHLIMFNYVNDFKLYEEVMNNRWKKRVPRTPRGKRIPKLLDSDDK